MSHSLSNLNDDLATIRRMLAYPYLSEEARGQLGNLKAVLQEKLLMELSKAEVENKASMTQDELFGLLEHRDQLVYSLAQPSLADELRKLLENQLSEVEKQIAKTDT